MKGSRIKLFTVIGLITVVLLQTSWLYSTYSLIKKNIEEQSNSLMLDATERELFSRFVLVSDNIPNGTRLVANKVDITGESSSKATHLCHMQESLLEYGSQLSLINLDSIYSTLLKEEGIYTKTAIYLINEHDSVIERSKEGNLPLFGSIELEKLPIRVDNSLYVKAVLINPYQTVFEQMTRLLIATIIMAIFVVVCIARQIRIIMKQNRIANIREDFSHAMIHDMKTPLTAITMSAKMLRSGQINNYPEKVERHFNIIENESQRLLKLTNKVLSIAQLEKDKLVLTKETIYLRPMIEDLIETFEVKTDKDVTFITHFETETAYAEYTYLKEAISNLIDNAIKYSHESVEIRITCIEKEKFTIIKVRDNGFGIDIKDQTTIFEKFERASAAKRSRKGGETGFGLGLNYVQRVVEAHGGTVTVNSVVNQYSEFTISIPMI